MTTRTGPDVVFFPVLQLTLLVLHLARSVELFSDNTQLFFFFLDGFLYVNHLRLFVRKIKYHCYLDIWNTSTII